MDNIFHFGNSNSTTALSDKLLEVYVPVSFNDFEYCGTGCWVTLAIFGLAAVCVIRKVILNLREHAATLTLVPVLTILVDTAAGILEVVYSVLGYVKVYNLHSRLTTSNKAWLALSSTGFWLSGMAEITMFFDDSGKDFLRGNGYWAGRNLFVAVFAEALFLYPCFGMAATNAVSFGWIVWIIAPLTFLLGIRIAQGHWVDIDPKHYLIVTRVLEAVTVLAPLLAIEVLATQRIGFVSGALVLKDLMEIMKAFHVCFSSFGCCKEEVASGRDNVLDHCELDPEVMVVLPNVTRAR